MTAGVAVFLTGLALGVTGCICVRFLDTVDSRAWHGDPSWTERSSVGGGFLTAAFAVVLAGAFLVVAGR